MGIEKLSKIDETLGGKYPFVNHIGKKVKYSPVKHTLEEGEKADYFNASTDKFGSGTVEDVALSNPGKNKIYTIGGGTHMQHRVWPQVDKYGNVLKDSNIVLKKILKNNSPEDIRKIINGLEKGLKNEANLSAKNKIGDYWNANFDYPQGRDKANLSG